MGPEKSYIYTYVCIYMCECVFVCGAQTKIVEKTIVLEWLWLYVLMRSINRIVFQY